MHFSKFGWLIATAAMTLPGSAGEPLSQISDSVAHMVTVGQNARGSVPVVDAPIPNQPQPSIKISEATYQGRPHFKVVSEQATYWYDCAGGGFSRIVDPDGADWISFKKEPLAEVPASAAAGFRGLPNLVFGKTNPDAGAGHPGFDQCSSSIVERHTIRTVSLSGRWAWSWHFTDKNATWTMEKAPAESKWWFLYEGTIAGRWSPNSHYWGTDAGGPNHDAADNGQKIFQQWQWAYFGDDHSPRVLLLVQSQADEAPDTLWFMGNTRDGLASPDGMVVFGFGRGPGTQPQLQGSGLRFAIGFVDNANPDASLHRKISIVAENWLQTGNSQSQSDGESRNAPTRP